jgi:hypothetical protein
VRKKLAPAAAARSGEEKAKAAVVVPHLMVPFFTAESGLFVVDIYILIRYSMFLATHCETHKICHSWPSFQPPGVGLEEQQQREQRDARECRVSFSWSLMR